MYMFCRDSKLLVMEKMRHIFALDPMGDHYTPTAPKCSDR